MWRARQTWCRRGEGDISGMRGEASVIGSRDGTSGWQANRDRRVEYEKSMSSRGYVFIEHAYSTSL